MSIDPLTWHVMLVLVSVGLAYLSNAGLKLLFPKLSFPVYGLALVMSLLLSWLLKLLNFDTYVDKQVITRVGSTATDYLVGFGIASININIVVKYWLPIVILSVLGVLYVIFWQFCVSKRFFHNYWFERGIYIFGMATGVMATGVILLRITDPEFKSGVLEDFGFAWIFLSIIDMLVVSLLLWRNIVKNIPSNCARPLDVPVHINPRLSCTIQFTVLSGSPCFMS